MDSKNVYWYYVIFLVSTKLRETYKVIVMIGKENLKKKVRIKFIKLYIQISLFWEFIPINYSSTNHNYHRLIATLDNKKILLFYEFKSESFFFLQVDQVQPYPQLLE